MAKWLLDWPNCRHKFTHSNIEPATIEQSYRDPFKIAARPKFPNGEKIACSNCDWNLSIKYQLIYSGEDDAQAAGV